MTIFLLIFVAILTAALALTLRATVRLIAQRDAERRRGDLALAGWKSDTHMHKAREAMLLDDLDFACSEAVVLRERLEVVEARELPQLHEIRARRAEGQRLASERDDLIAQGVDPRDLLVPVWPSEGGAS